MSVDNRIPSEPYMELNGVTIYTEGVYCHGKSPEISKGTIGEKLMDKEYNGLGTHGTMGVERVNMDAKGEAGVSHKLGVYGIGRTPELNDLIYGKGVIDGKEY